MNSIQVPCSFRAIGIALLCWSAAALLAEEPATITIVPAPELPASLPWDLAALSQPPAFEWLDDGKHDAMTVIISGGKEGGEG